MNSPRPNRVITLTLTEDEALALRDLLAAERPQSEAHLQAWLQKASREVNTDSNSECESFVHECEQKSRGRVEILSDMPRHVRNAIESVSEKLDHARFLASPAMTRSAA